MHDGTCPDKAVRTVVARPLPGPVFNINGADRLPALESQIQNTHPHPSRPAPPMPSDTRNPRQGGL